MLIFNCKKSLPNARKPMYATNGAACFDLFAADVVTTEPNAVVYNTGLQLVEDAQADIDDASQRWGIPIDDLRRLVVTYNKL